MTLTIFLENVVPNIYSYMHELNYQKFYKTTTSDEQMAMAFVGDTGLFDFIEKIIGSLYEGYKYDKYIVDKYQLCRRILDGTITSKQIPVDATTPRQKVTFMKNVSNLMSFRSPNFNPAGINRATAFENQILIMDTKFEAEMTTEVLATSYFKNDAEFKTRMALIDGFDNHDDARLRQVLKSAYIPFTSDELTQLSTVSAVNVSDDFFQDYYYSLNNDPQNTSTGATKKTDFYNPETLRRNHWLHTWFVISTSPFANACVFTTEQPSVTSVSINPAESSITHGQSMQLNANVKTVGFANKAVVWEVTKQAGAVTPVTVDSSGKVNIPVDFSVVEEETAQIEIQATSVYDSTKKGTASITVL